jgi:predicted regulator of Ras-like GTPase activity (Roadblock/LC7/MglB family)
VSLYNKFSDIVKDANKRIKVLDAAILVNSEGLILASVVGKQFSEERIGALAAQFCSHCERFSQNIGHEEFELTLVNSKTGYVVLCGLSNKIYFVAKSQNKSKIGDVMSVALKVIADLRELEDEINF